MRVWVLLIGSDPYKSDCIPLSPRPTVKQGGGQSRMCLDDPYTNLMVAYLVQLIESAKDISRANP